VSIRKNASVNEEEKKIARFKELAGSPEGVS